MDALAGEATLDRHPEAIKQAAVADRLRAMGVGGGEEFWEAVRGNLAVSGVGNLAVDVRAEIIRVNATLGHLFFTSRYWPSNFRAC